MLSPTFCAAARPGLRTDELSGPGNGRGSLQPPQEMATTPSAPAPSFLLPSCAFNQLSVSALAEPSAEPNPGPASPWLARSGWHDLWAGSPSPEQPPLTTPGPQLFPFNAAFNGKLCESVLPSDRFTCVWSPPKNTGFSSCWSHTTGLRGFPQTPTSLTARDTG